VRQRERGREREKIIKKILTVATATAAITRKTAKLATLLKNIFFYI
jgi:hypothetical protein